jgi:hypothetical protein
MRAFLAIKHYDNIQNKDLIENITKVFKKISIDIFVFVRDVEKYNSWELSPEELMERAFAEIDQSEIFIIEASEASIGIGIEACYAYMKGIPVYIIARKGVRVSNTIKGISTKCFIYDELDDLLEIEI